MNITGAVAGNPRFQDLKTVLCTNMFNGQENLRKFHQRKGDQSCSKDSCLLCRKTVTLGNGIKLRQDLYLSMRKLSNLSRSFAFGNLSRGVLFSVDLFFRRGRPMNITGAVAGKPSIPSHKNCTVLNCFKHTFSVNNHAIVSSRHVCFAN